MTGLARADDRDGVLVHAMGVADLDLLEAGDGGPYRDQTCGRNPLTAPQFERALADAGFEEVEIRDTHRVHEHAAAAIVRARKPGHDR